MHVKGGHELSSLLVVEHGLALLSLQVVPETLLEVRMERVGVLLVALYDEELSFVPL